MSISSMALIEIVAPRRRSLDLITCMQDFGSLQLEEVPLVVPGARSYLHRDQLSDQQVKDQARYREILELLAGMKAVWDDSSHPGPDALKAAREALRDEGGDYLLLQVSRIKRQGESLLRRRANIASDIRSLGNYQRRLDELAGLLDAADTGEKMDHIALLIGPGDRYQFEAVTQSLSRVTEERLRVLQARGSGKEGKGADVVLLVFPSEYEARVRGQLEESELPELRLPREVRNLPLAQAVEHLQEQGRVLPRKLKDVEKTLADLKSEKLATVFLVDRICSDSLARMQATELAAHSDMLTVVHAWLPSGDRAGFKRLLHDRLGDTVTVSELKDRSGQAATVPVRLNNLRLFRPFEKLLSLFSVPLYGSFDPTPIIAVVFPLFFGLILGDIGYGLILLGLTLWARRKWRHVPLALDITGIAVWCSSASILFGIIFGEFLGDLGHRTGVIPLTVGGIRILPVWESRDLIIDELLVLAIVIGFVHIVSGLVLGIVEAIRMKDRHHLMERLGLLVGLLGLVVLILPAAREWFPGPVRKTLGGLCVGGAVVTLAISNGAAGPIELVSLVANILSYCRLMALGVAGMVLANLANSVAAAQTSFIVGLLLALPIHLLAVALGVLEPTIHALRLHFVEFLPKFFVGDGRSYAPLRRKGQDYEE